MKAIHRLVRLPQENILKTADKAMNNRRFGQIDVIKSLLKTRQAELKALPALFYSFSINPFKLPD